MNDRNQTRQTIQPEKPSAVALIFFWIMVFLLPALATKTLLNWQINKTIEEVFLQDSKALQNEMELFKHDLRLENFIYQAIREAQPQILPLLPETHDISSLDRFCADSARLLANIASCPPALMIAYSPESKKAGFFMADDTDYVLGRRSSQIFVESIGLKKNEMDPARKRRFDQMVNSILGDLIELPETPATIKVGFTSKGRPDKIFSYYDFMQIDKRNRLKIFLLFAESSFSIRKIISQASNSSPANIVREIKLLKTIPERDFERSNSQFLSYSSPVPPETLRIGSHKAESWYDHAIESGQARIRPGKYPYAVVTMNSGKHAIPILKYLPLINLALVIIVFAGLLLIKLILDDYLPGKTLQTRLRLSIFLATLLPFASLIMAAQQFSSHFKNVVTRNRSHDLRNDLIMLETRIKSNDLKHREKVNRDVRVFKGIKNSSKPEVEAFLNQRLGSLYAGYTMLRSDGLLIEKLPPANISSSYDYHKLLLVRDLMLSQAYRVFQTQQMISAESEKAFKKLPGFSTWKAFSIHFNEIDTNNFFMQDGRFYPAMQADSSHFMISTHNFWAESKSEGHSGILLLVIDRKKIFEKFLSENTSIQKTFFKRNQGSLTHIAVFSCHDNSLEEIDTGIAWPMSALSDKEFTEASRRINKHKIQAGWSQEDDNGITKVFSARALSDLPVKLIAKSETTVTAIQKKVIAIIIPIMIIYSIILVYLISRLLSHKFISPLQLIIGGISALQSGRYPLISYKSTNEFGNLINEFNSMVKGMKQRNLLERFISKEVSETIADETQNLQKEQTELVFRTVMFIHIRNFVQLCEQIPAENSIAMLNLYFSSLEPEILKEGGQIDKYIGDGIMISFSDRSSDRKSEFSAAKAAIACMKVLQNLNQKLQDKNLPQICIGIGLATGKVIRGRIGSKSGRQDFTLIGDTVNLAARLESASHFDASSNILISESIAQALNKDFRAVFFKQMIVKGKTEPVKIFILHEYIDEK